MLVDVLKLKYIKSWPLLFFSQVGMLDRCSYNIKIWYKYLALFTFFSGFIIRSSHRRCSVRKVLRNFGKFTGKHLCQSLLLNKVAGLSPATFLKKRLWHRCFPVSFVKSLRTPFLQNTSWRLLLYHHKN